MSLVLLPIDKIISLSMGAAKYAYAAEHFRFIGQVNRDTADALRDACSRLVKSAQDNGGDSSADAASSYLRLRVNSISEKLDDVSKNATLIQKLLDAFNGEVDKLLLELIKHADGDHEKTSAELAEFSIELARSMATYIGAENSAVHAQREFISDIENGEPEVKDALGRVPEQAINVFIDDARGIAAKLDSLNEFCESAKNATEEGGEKLTAVFEYIEEKLAKRKKNLKDATEDGLLRKTFKKLV